MTELEIPESPEKSLLEERIKSHPKVQWLLGQYADKNYPIIDKRDIEAALTEVLDEVDRLKGDLAKCVASVLEIQVDSINRRSQRTQ